MFSAPRYSKLKKILFIIMLLAMAVSVNAKKKEAKDFTIYAYGVATSFNDTIAYMTDVIQIDGAYFDAGTKFIGGRHEYSVQLKEYMASQGKPDRMCAFFYSLKREKAEKAYVKLRKRLQTKGHNEVRQLTKSDFTFKPQLRDY